MNAAPATAALPTTWYSAIQLCLSQNFEGLDVVVIAACKYAERVDDEHCAEWWKCAAANAAVWLLELHRDGKAAPDWFSSWLLTVGRDADFSAGLLAKDLLR